MDVTPLDQIHIIERDSIIPFEWPLSDEGRADVDDALLRHPPAVMALGKDSYLLLSGLDTIRAMEAEGFDHLPVQICSPDQITVCNGVVVLLRFTYEDLHRTAARTPDRMEIIEGSPETVPTADERIIRFQFLGGPSGVILLRDSGKVGCSVALDLLARSILQNGSYFGAGDPHSDPDNLLDLPGLTGTLTLPAMSLSDLEAAAVADRLFPPSLVDVSISGRVLNLDFPLHVLADDSPIGAKEDFLRQLILLRLRRRCLTYHPGGVYLLNS